MCICVHTKYIKNFTNLNRIRTRYYVLHVIMSSMGVVSRYQTVNHKKKLYY